MQYAHERGERVPGVKPTRPVVLPPLSTVLWDRMRDYLTDRGLSFDLAMENGWYPAEVYRTPRIVIPAQSLINTWPYYQARAMDNNPKRYDSPSAPRGDALVVCYPSGEADAAVIVEGPMDALAAAEVGMLGIALMGNTPSEEVFTHLRTLLDNYDAFAVADIDSTEEIVNVVHGLWARGRMCKFIPMRGYKDLADVPAHRRLQLLQ